jgi:hypothetical protein
MRSMILAALVAFSTAAHATGEHDVNAAGWLHLEYTDITIAAERCPGLAINLNAWKKDMRQTGGPQADILLHAFVASQQGEEWYGKRDKEFADDPTKQCAEAEKNYGPGGNGLLIRKKQ